MVTIWLQLCTSYSSNCHHHFIIFLNSNKIRNGDILVLAYPGCPGKMAVKQVLSLSSLCKRNGPSWHYNYNTATVSSSPGLSFNSICSNPSIYFTHTHTVSPFSFPSQITLTYFRLLLDVGLLVLMIWLELSTTYSFSIPAVTTISIILCFTKHQLTQVHLENGH